VRGRNDSASTDYSNLAMMLLWDFESAEFGYFSK
jgi:hypothetical protein